ncbi:DeoR/GlpR family DNA-binding transcription regulator [Paenarthrobacter sp. NPDC092416]|uniref:DeoR/GlpR family DNA-binding transcription regulator n=1 Tax=Paenarthrobacter sp. NPDC092416 TaxID=3364386 RepID=UPI0037F4DBB8
MNAKERRTSIEATLGVRPASVEDLAEEFGVSPSTIRRDLDRLTSTGRIHRTYGGAVPAAYPPRERSLLEREQIAGDAKRKIGRFAASLVAPHSVNLLDAGTTVGAMAENLTSRNNLTVITNGMTCARILEHAEGVDLVLLGGSLRHISSGTVGPLAEAALHSLTADAAFLGADGVDPNRGLSESTDQQASLKRLMIDAANEVYVLADATKLGATSAHWWTAIARPWTLITDYSATPEQLDAFSKRPEITVCVVPE